ncbi:MAG: hypothetical protein GKR92_03485 [Gammaproteobacteria bacterium]|nr:MAG: hypothetical protein GKR92_03485 [Gammaproteobacteria bacterium]
MDDLRKKGQQCIDWKKSSEKAQRASVTGCLMSCARLAAMADQNPELLTEDRIKQCNEEHAAIERIVSGEPPVPKEVVQAPETIEAIIKDMNKKEQECKAKMESAKTPLDKEHASACANTCYRSAFKINRGGVPLEQAKANWKMCVRR